MTKHDLLTQEEFLKHRFYPPIYNALEKYRMERGLEPHQVNVLDWGCGRGRDALWLLERGYNAYGVDIDREPIENALSLYGLKGHQEDRLCLIDLSAKSNFADGFFHFTFSNQSFEHASNLEQIAAELWRVTAVDGAGLHIYPPDRGVREGHLYMPFVHWLPKNRSRWYLINLCVALGIEPHWEELNGKSVRQKTDRYYEYILNNTFYRTYPYVQKLFEGQGFRVSFVTIDHPEVQASRLVGPLARARFTRPLINYLLIEFVRVELLIKKPL
jgi:SAM-dependent methyltransferase